MTTVGVPTLPARLAGRYEIGRVLGRGVGSTVFLAHDTLLGRDTALKTFRVEADPRAGRELSLLAKMDHPGLVPVYDVEEHDGRAFVVMALLDGGSLADRLAGPDGGPLPLPDALRTGAAVAGALEHVHRAGVLHRAVTPANVLYDVDGRAHLSDFGVALVADAPRLTDTGLTVGAAPYLAPEQVRGESPGPGADVYALALVLLEALTGRRAFPGDPLSAAQARLDRGPAVPDDLPADVAALLTAMTASDPDDRPDAAAASGTLRRALVAAEPATAPAVLTTPGLLVAGPVATSAGPVAVMRGAVTGHAPGPRPRATGTRGVLVLAGLAARAVLAGTVAIASSGPVAEMTADADRPAVVAGGAAVGVPDPSLVVPASPAPPVAAPPATEAPDEDAAPVTTARTQGPQPVRATASRPSATRSSQPTAEPTRTREPDDADADETTRTDPDDAVQAAPATRERERGPVGEVLDGVGGLVGGVLGTR
ncbi:serine/threonine-protein kinase [Actinomycetospora atypica]|uniref:non-specific serine/threonine protein kinase n=1 Tax=Actinomycetospora atypica TaxID=1290095 RepID=A0ABV9YS98_9PSEU